MSPAVLIIIDTGIIGGPGRGLLQFLRHLPSGAARCTLCTFAYARPKSTQFIDEVRRRGLALELLRQRFPFDPAAIVDAWRLLRRGKFTVVQTHNYKSHFIAWVLRPFLRFRWVAFAHGWTTEDWKVRLYHSLDRLMLRTADHAVAVSPPLYSTIRAWRGARPTELILNAADAEEVARGEGREAFQKQLGLASDDLVIGCFGRLSSEKGQDVLIEAFSRIVGDFPAARLLLVGNGPDEQALRVRARELNVQDRVLFAGYYAGMRDCFDAIQLLVIPSRSEGLPNVLLEAMALGVPVLATRVGAIPEVLTGPGLGWVVSPGDAKQLEVALRDALGSAEKRRSVAEEAKRRLFPRFDPAARAASIVKLYQANPGQSLTV